MPPTASRRKLQKPRTEVTYSSGSVRFFSRSSSTILRSASAARKTALIGMLSSISQNDSNKPQFIHLTSTLSSEIGSPFTIGSSPRRRQVCGRSSLRLPRDGGQQRARPKIRVTDDEIFEVRGPARLD